MKAMQRLKTSHSELRSRRPPTYLLLPDLLPSSPFTTSLHCTSSYDYNYSLFFSLMPKNDLLSLSLSLSFFLLLRGLIQKQLIIKERSFVRLFVFSGSSTYTYSLLSLFFSLGGFLSLGSVTILLLRIR